MQFPSIFSKILRQNRKIAANAETAMEWTDMHSHLLPGIDDGCKNIDETVELLKRFSAAGCRKLFTTPHVMGDFYRNSSATILEKLEEVRNAIKLNGLNITVDASAEYYMDEFFSELVKSKDILTFGNNYVLVETGFISEPPSFKEDIFNLQIAGYHPVLAHPERYLYLHDNLARLRQMADAGIMLQMNVMSLAGYYSPRIRKVAEYMVQNGLVNFIGSDVHNSRHFEIVMQAIHTPAFAKLQLDKLCNFQL